MKNNIQTPLFLSEIFALLQAKGISRVVDATFGEGGHGLNLAKQGYQVLGIEWDPQMFSYAKLKRQTLAQPELLTLVNDNFANLAAICRQNQYNPEAIIIDLGLSMRQLALDDRGFSTKKNLALDLRLNPQVLSISAAAFLAGVSDSELTDFCYSYLETKHAGAIGQAMNRFRAKQPIQNVYDLKIIIQGLKGLKSSEQEGLLRLLLQGLRMVVNHEKENLIRILESGGKILKKQGLIIIITFQSFEDRTVKRFFKNHPLFLEVYKKPRLQKEYSFARSAKLRVYVKNK